VRGGEVGVGAVGGTVQRKRSVGEEETDRTTPGWVSLKKKEVKPTAQEKTGPLS